MRSLASFALSIRGKNRKRMTRTAPAASPNMASEIAMKAKWYHMVTLKILVRNSSSCNSERVVKNRPV